MTPGQLKACITFLNSTYLRQNKATKQSKKTKKQVYYITCITALSTLLRHKRLRGNNYCWAAAGSKQSGRLSQVNRTKIELKCGRWPRKTGGLPIQVHNIENRLMHGETGRLKQVAVN